MTRRNFLDFDVQLTRHSDGYIVRVLQSPAGQASAQSAASSLAVEANWFASTGEYLPGATEVERSDATKSMGTALFQAVFRDDVLFCLGQSLVEARHNNCGLRIKLRLSDAPELIALPWEYLFHPGLNRYVALSTETTVMHYLDLPRKAPPLSVALPLRILVVTSTPRDLPWLDSEQEWNVLKDAMNNLIRVGAVTLERIDMTTLHDLQSKLRTHAYHVMHYIGHGVFNEDNGQGSLMLCAQDGSAASVPAQDLALVVGDVPSLRLVVLNGCQGSQASQANPFSGVAQAMVQQGVPAVLAMSAAISDQAAILLTREFYAALADGQPVDAALAEARKAIATQLQSLEWGIPRLVMHADDGRLWELHPSRTRKDLLTVQAVDNSLAILSALLTRPDFKAKLISMQAGFEVAGSQIELLTNYKDLHDLLHNLQYLCFSGLVQEVHRFPEDTIAFGILLDHEMTLGGLIDNMIGVARRPGMPAGELDWIQELVDAQNLLRQGIESADKEPLQRAIWLIKRVLDRHPTRINERLNAAARNLQLPMIEQAMRSIRTDLRRLKLPPQQVRRFESGVAALGDLNNSLSQLVEDHDRWQAVDLELRRIEAVISYDMSEIKTSWPELRAKVDPLCHYSGAAWAEHIQRDSRTLDKALATGNQAQILRSFQRYRRRVGNRFYQVDADLKALCHELRYVGQPLSTTFSLISS